MDLEAEPRQYNAKGEIVEHTLIQAGSGTTVATSTATNGGNIEQVTSNGRYSQSPPKDSIPYELLMANLRGAHGYLVVDEKKRGLTKKKRFLPKDARAMQSRINLKFPEMQNLN